MEQHSAIKKQNPDMSNPDESLKTKANKQNQKSII